jgi:uncharacterized protein
MDKVVHFEIPSDDLARAKEFYGSIFGWEINEIPEVNYTSLTTNQVDEQQLPKERGVINGGMFKRSPEVPSTPVITIGVDDVEISLKEIEAHGGTVVAPRTEVPGMGAFAYFKDTEGNVLGLWETAGR